MDIKGKRTATGLHSGGSHAARRDCRTIAAVSVVDLGPCRLEGRVSVAMNCGSWSCWPKVDCYHASKSRRRRLCGSRGLFRQLLQFGAGAKDDETLLGHTIDGVEDEFRRRRGSRRVQEGRKVDPKSFEVPRRSGEQSK